MVRIIVAEDQSLVRDALVRLLDMEQDLEIIGSVGSGQEMIDQVRELTPDLCLVDIEMPGIDGLEACRIVHQEMPEVRLAILTTFNRPGYLKRALLVGVQGFLLKDQPVDELVHQIRRIMLGERIVDPALALTALVDGDSPLTARETEILRVAAEGASIRELAAVLYLSAGTVSNYLSMIIQKLQVHNRNEAVLLAREKGWL